MSDANTPTPAPACACDMRTRLVGDGCDVCNPPASTPAPAPDAELSARVAELRAWARSRLAHAERTRDAAAEEGANITADEMTGEARTLRSVLRILDGDAP